MRTTSKTFHNGSSPLTRGTPVQTASIRGLLRFIPAYAGNSVMTANWAPLMPVHPRLRGELISLSDADLDFVGSSPLTRGTHSQEDPLSASGRFIPAYAGNSERRSCCSVLLPVHPRLRGELSISVTFVEAGNGSSPLTRGTQFELKSILRVYRFIPAYAGNSSANVALRVERPVHPRLRGELRSFALNSVFLAGSSPLTRGTHLNKA